MSLVTDTRVVGSAQAMIDAYEEVRCQFVGPADGFLQRHGISVLVHRGMAVWAQTWARLSPASSASTSEPGTIGGTRATNGSERGQTSCVPRSLESQLVSTLAGMILPVVTGEEHVG